MYLLLVFIPMMCSMITLLFGRNIGIQGATKLTTISISSVALISLYLGITQSQPVHINLLTWFTNDTLNVNWGLQFDSITYVMLVVVTAISALVHLYSTEYMGTDPHLPRFMSYLSLFTFFMLILVTADNIVQLFIGWEGVGTCSYLLINYWYTRIQANKSAIKAMVVNRVGDMALSLAMFCLIYMFNSIEFSTIFANIATVNNTIIILGLEINLISVTGILIFIGAVGKSAQLTLHTWLPDAMEGPTPVSALIHAATMVTAGVYLIIRCSPLYEHSNISLTLITIVGALTAFFAATVGLLQNDIKRVIAYSTCSQLGYMVFAAGLSSFSVSLFHLFNHAFFKALLFLSAGSVIHALADEQDFRKIGGLISKVPLTYSLVLIGSLSLAGFPYLTGFYSKDIILELAYGTYTIPSTFAYWLGTISAFCTAYYSMRLIYFTFLSAPLTSKEQFNNAGESGIAMTIPLIILGFASIFIGFVCKDYFVGLGSQAFNQSIFISPQNNAVYEAEFLPAWIKNIPVVFSLIGAALGVYLLSAQGSVLYNWKISPLGNAIYKFLNSKWYFDVIYNKFIVKPALNIGHDITYKIIDRGVLEYFGPNGLYSLVVKLSQMVSTTQIGQIYNYTFTMIIGLSVLLLPTIIN
uniref:NADH-ubiquinone oxidoreductase chain 5 n=1 Tax=Capsaspora owczarzaki TaxID=192875 RepID=M1JZL0_9EUKA|nr:NADH dehydrogenase subunit 5 [Capsaspora owczarzaki]